MSTSSSARRETTRSGAPAGTRSTGCATTSGSPTAARSSASRRSWSGCSPASTTGSRPASIRRATSRPTRARRPATPTSTTRSASAGSSRSSAARTWARRSSRRRRRSPAPPRRSRTGSSRVATTPTRSSRPVAAAHAHDHAHDQAHSHAPAPDADRRWLSVALGLILAFMVVEVVAGVLADSLALLSDAAHMLTDAGSIGLALFAARLAARPPGGRFTFGLGRAEILSAQVNGASLLVLAGVIAWEALQRLGDPPEVEGAIVLVVGLAGAGVNVGAAWALSRAERRSLNVEGARAHVLTDLYASLGAAVAGLLVIVAGFDMADGIVALLVAALMIRSGVSLVGQSTRVLLEAAPRGIDPQAVGNALAGHPGIVEVHDLHVWEVTSGFPSLSAHVLVPAGEDCHARRAELEQVLAERFGLEHTTLQVEHEAEGGLIDITR